MEKIYFHDSNNNELCGILSNPTKNTNRPVIIICHGFGSSKDGHTPPALQKILDKNGISTLRFDFFGHGESGGNFSDITISEAVNNILSAISFLKKLGYNKIGLVGSSFGGISSTIAASKSKDLFALILKSPVSDYEEVELLMMGRNGIDIWKQKGYVEYENNMRLKYSFYEDIKNNNAYGAAKKIKIPVLIVHGDNDEVVPVKQSEKIAKLIKNCRLEIIKNADHNMSDDDDFQRTLDIISKFIIAESSKL